MVAPSSGDEDDDGVNEEDGCENAHTDEVILVPSYLPYLHQTQLTRSVTVLVIIMQTWHSTILMHGTAEQSSMESESYLYSWTTWTGRTP